MIDSIRNMKLNFFQQFLGADPTGSKVLRDYVSITDSDEVEILQIPFQYFHISSGDIVEAPMERYPIMSFQDFMPSPVDGWNNFVQPRYAGLRDTDNDGVLDTTSLQPPAIRFNHRWEISVCAKDEKSFTSINDWMYRTFDFSKHNAVFVYNKKLIGETFSGDFVNYTLTSITDNPRTDGLFENLYIFEINLWADLKPAKDVTTLLEQVTVEFNTSNNLDQIQHTYTPIGISFT